MLLVLGSLLVASAITNLFSHPPTHTVDFEFSVSCYPIPVFFVEFAIMVRLWWSARHNGY